MIVFFLVEWHLILCGFFFRFKFLVSNSQKFILHLNICLIILPFSDFEIIKFSLDTYIAYIKCNDIEKKYHQQLLELYHVNIISVHGPPSLIRQVIANSSKKPLEKQLNKITNCFRFINNEGWIYWMIYTH